MRIALISAVTSPAQQGAAIVDWMAGLLSAVDDVELDVVDLRELGLPFYDEPELPRHGRYVHEHTKSWSARIAAADAFVFVTPEYNHSFSALLKNALDYLFHEWCYKPAAIVSYGGGVSAGLRGADHLRLVLAALNVLAIQESVMVPFVSRHIVEGVFEPNEPMALGAELMVRELMRARTILEPMHAMEPPVTY